MCICVDVSNVHTCMSACLPVVLLAPALLLPALLPSLAPAGALCVCWTPLLGGPTVRFCICVCGTPPVKYTSTFYVGTF